MLVLEFGLALSVCLCVRLAVFVFSAQCATPRTVTNGFLRVTNTAVGSKATVICNPNYVLVGGDGSSTCQATGIWGTPAGSCQSKSSIYTRKGVKIGRTSEVFRPFSVSIIRGNRAPDLCPERKGVFFLNRIGDLWSKPVCNTTCSRYDTLPPV